MSAPATPSAVTAQSWTLADLRAANEARQAAWCPDQVPDLSFRGNELGGETGEALNVVKKLERERHGWRGSRATLDDLAQEIADVVICADLLAMTAGIDLMEAVHAKFDATSEKVGLPHRLAALAVRAAPTEQPRPAASSPPDGAVSEAIREAITWHEARDKELSKQPPGGDRQWRRMEHREEIDRLTAVLDAARVRAAQGPGAEAQPVAYGIIDPDYARIFTMARCLAWQEGYALVMHGSFTRDLDLIAIPWTERATERDRLVKRIASAFEELDLLVKDADGATATEKPHGRRAWTLTFKAFGDPRFVDLSVMPRAIAPQTDLEAVRREERAAERERCAKVAESFKTGEHSSCDRICDEECDKIADAIRALPDEASR